MQMPANCPVCGTRHRARSRHASATTAPIRSARPASARSSGTSRAVARWTSRAPAGRCLSQLLERGLVKTRGDFFRLTVEDLESLDRFARKSAQNLHAVDPARPGAAALSHHPRAGHPAGWRPDGHRPGQLDRPALAAARRRADGRQGRLVRARGPRAAQRARRASSRRSTASARPWPPASSSWLTDPATAGVLDDLVDAGVEPERPAVVAADAAGAGPLAGKTVVVTGTLSSFDRQAAENAIRAAGGKAGGLGQQEDRLPRRRRQRGIEAGQGAGAGRAGLDEEAFQRLLKGDAI